MMIDFQSSPRQVGGNFVIVVIKDPPYLKCFTTLPGEILAPFWFTAANSPVFL